MKSLLIFIVMFLIQLLVVVFVGGVVVISTLFVTEMFLFYRQQRLAAKTDRTIHDERG